jgi:hypothetical protein
MAGGLYRLGRLCANRAGVMVAVWLGLVLVVQLLVQFGGAETSNDLSLPGTESQQATDLLAGRFPPQQNGSSPIVFHVTSGKITDTANKQAVESWASASTTPCSWSPSIATSWPTAWSSASRSPGRSRPRAAPSCSPAAP